jgi:hypothetical protein
LRRAQCACAGVFSVTLGTIYMTPKDRAVAVTITNEADEQVVLQADIYEWGKARRRRPATAERGSHPRRRRLKLGAKAKQWCGCAAARPDASRQLIYRLILRELPEAGPRKASPCRSRSRSRCRCSSRRQVAKHATVLHGGAQRNRNALGAMREQRQRLRAGARGCGAPGRPGRGPLRGRRLHPARGAQSASPSKPQNPSRSAPCSSSSRSTTEPRRASTCLPSEGPCPAAHRAWNAPTACPRRKRRPRDARGVGSGTQPCGASGEACRRAGQRGGRSGA